MRAASILALTIALPAGLALPGLAVAQDADGDGVPNAADTFPCDDGGAGVVFAPAENDHGMLLFEDRWPAAGDLDFNDLALGYHYALRTDASGAVRSVRATLNVLALGGTLHYGLGLHLPVSASRATSITVRVDGGSPRSVAASESDDELTVELMADLRSLYGSELPVNSRDGEAAQPRHTIEVDIVFGDPVQLSTVDAPYDVFVFRSTDRGHQIHRPQFGGTAAMNAALFGTADDASEEGRWFVDTTGIPFAIVLPTISAYPREAVGIEALYPAIVDFAASGGTSSLDFYRFPVAASAYAGAPAPTLSEPEAIDQSCLVSCSAPVTGTCGATACLTGIAADGVQASLTPSAGQVGNFVACGVAGQRWTIAASTSGGCFDVRVTDGAGTQVWNNLYCGAALIELAPLATDGDVRVEVDPRGSSATVYATVHSVPADVTALVALPTTNLSLAPITVPGQNARALVNGTVGQRIAFQVRSGGRCYWYRFLAPDGGTVIANNLACGDYFSGLLVLPATGQYTLVLDAYAAELPTFGIDAWVVPADLFVDGSIAGGAMSMSLEGPQRGTFRFSGTSGQRVSMTGEVPGAACYWYTLTAPSGAAVLSRNLNCGGFFFEPRVLPETGTYSFYFEAYGAGRPTIDVDLFDVPADASFAATVGGGAVSIPVPAPGANATVTFSGTSGQRIALLTTQAGTCLTARLTGPSGVVFDRFDCGPIFSDVITLPATGTYTIAVDPYGASQPAITVEVVAVPVDAAGAVTIGGGAASFAVTAAGQNVAATMSGDSGQRVSVHFNPSGGACTRSTTIRAPSGTAIYSAGINCGSFTAGNLQLTESGTYRLEVDIYGDARPTVAITATAQ